MSGVFFTLTGIVFMYNPTACSIPFISFSRPETTFPNTISFLRLYFCNMTAHTVSKKTLSVICCSFTNDIMLSVCNSSIVSATVSTQFVLLSGSITGSTVATVLYPSNNCFQYSIASFLSLFSSHFT